ncbi:MAG: T9SS type A sorting domain-containing protein [Melioribacteraceae bacterium]
MKRIHFLLILIILIYFDVDKVNAQWVQSKLPNGSVGNERYITSIVTSGPNIYAGTNSGGLFLSTNNGDSWIASGLTDQSINSIAIIGTNLFAGTKNNGVFLSTNQGSNWVSAGLSSYSVTALLVNGTNLFAGTYGGVFLSTNNGANWIAYNIGLNNTNVHALAINGNYLFAGTDGGVFLSTNNGTNWISTGLSYKSIKSLIVIGLYVFAGTDGGEVLRTSNNGTNWNYCTGFSQRPINALVLNGNYLFSGSNGDGIFLSPNYGTSWLAINNDLNYTWVYSLLVSASYIFVGTDWNSIWRRPLSDIVLPQYTVTLLSNPINGGITTGDGTYNFGSSATVTASPSPGYVFVNWTEGTSTISTNANDTFTIENNKTFTANFLSAPSAPIATNATSITQTSFKANWNAASTTTKYFLDVAIDANFNNILSTYNNKDVGNVTTFSITGLTVASTFFYRVRAYNSAGVSANSNTITITTLPNAPTAPIAKVATNTTQTSFTADWNSVSGATGYYFDLAINANFTNLLTNYNNKDVGNVTSLAINGLATNFTYYYRVRAYNTGGTSGNSNTIIVNLTSDVEQIENEKPMSFKLFQNYPNPFNPTTKIQFDLPKDVVVRLSVFNTLGQEIAVLVNQQLSGGTYSVDFDATKLPNGIYFYKIQAGSFSQTKKLVLLK